ncbi:MAG TPA: diguanylate cyclase [Thermoleophilaceae bacterium]|jgi:diguanylate cyclase (GGDEF)-like protein
MSFRSRLFLFFTIIVVVPMISVAIVLFKLTASSETGKVDARLYQAQRTDEAEYDHAVDAARREGVGRDRNLVRALVAGRPGAIERRIRQLRAAHPEVVSVVAYDGDRRAIAQMGTTTAVAPSVTAVSARENGATVGFVATSVTTADEYAGRLAKITDLEVHVSSRGRALGSTLDGTGSEDVETGSRDVTIAGADYRGRFTAHRPPAGPPVEVGVLASKSDLSSSVNDQRLLIGAILLAFLLLALLSSRMAVRALQTQIDQFLEAARRLARGDFSRPVPVEGADEFAALGREFNAMSSQLESKIEEVERKRAELEGTIRRVGDAFATGLDREGMVKLAVRTAVEACEAETGRALPIDARRMSAARVGAGDPRLDGALEAAERKAFAVDGAAGPDWLATLEGQTEGDDHRPVRADSDGVYALAAPLVARLGRGGSHEQVGVISIARTSGDFDDNEYELFTYLTGQAAISIENVDLHEIVQTQAVTDELTGLYNLRHFHDTLDGEIERSRRFGTDVGLAMLDIDDFKQINDTFGHQQGDRVLLEVGRVLRSLSRDIDEPARYGGEEMAVILPQTDVTGAELLAERMRVAIERLEIKSLDGRGPLQVTASFGVASLPASAADKAGLIAEADAALYRAKRAGKNRVERPVGSARPPTA